MTGLIYGSSPPPAVIIPSTTDPTQQVPNPTFTTWFQKDQLLLSWLLSSLTKEVYPYIIGLTSSYNVWQALANTFGSISLNRQLQLYI